MRRKRLGSLLLLGLLLPIAVTTGCSGSSDESEASEAATSGSGPFVLISTYVPTGEGGDGAQLAGRVEIDAESRCVRIIEREFGVSVTPVFPVGEVTLSRSGFSYGGTYYSDGTDIELGGGDLGEDLSTWREYIEEPCDANRAFIVAQAG